MLFKNVAGQGLYVFLYNATTGAGVAGEAANLTATLGKDGAAAGATATANPTDRGGGVYWWPLSQAETNADALALLPAHATHLVAPVFVYTTAGAVPKVTAGDASGLALVGSQMDLQNAPNATAIAAIAKGVLVLDLDQAENDAANDSLCTFCLAGLFSSVSGTTWTIKKTGGTTKTTKTLTVDSDAAPITGVS